MELHELEIFPERGLGRIRYGRLPARTLHLTIQDEQGRPFFDQAFAITPDEPGTLEFPLTALPPGRYHAWISANGAMGVRSFELATNPGYPRPSFFQDLFAKFKLN